MTPKSLNYACSTESFRLSADGYTLEGAMNVEGPWEVVEGTIIEEDGLFKMAVPTPTSIPFEAFRLREVGTP